MYINQSDPQVTLCCRKLLSCMLVLLLYSWIVNSHSKCYLGHVRLLLCFYAGFNFFLSFNFILKFHLIEDIYVFEFSKTRIYPISNPTDLHVNPNPIPSDPCYEAFLSHPIRSDPKNQISADIYRFSMNESESKDFLKRHQNASKEGSSFT